MGEKFTGVSHMYFAPADGSQPMQEVKLSEPVCFESEEQEEAPLRSVGPITFTIKADRKTLHKLFPKQRVPRRFKKGVNHLCRHIKRNTKAFRAFHNAMIANFRHTKTFPTLLLYTRRLCAELIEKGEQ